MDRGLVEELKRVVKWNSDLEKSCLKFSKIITETELQKIKEQDSADQKTDTFLAAVSNAQSEASNDNILLDLVYVLRSSKNGPAADIVQNFMSRKRKIFKTPDYNVVEPKNDEPLIVEVKEATRIKGGQKAYNMTSNPRGHALIINNKNFEDGTEHKHREGSEVDEANLTNLLEQLGFVVTLNTDLRFEQFYKKIEHFSRESFHAECDMSIVVVMSHGNKDGFYTTDGKVINRGWLIKQFTAASSPQLMNKPKLFIFSACRGIDLDFGVDNVDKPAAKMPRKRTSSSCFDADPSYSKLMESEQASKEPSWQDIFIASSTIPDYVSHRDLEKGTWFIECICRIFMEHACEDDLITLFNKVSKKLGEFSSEGGTKQSCTVEMIHFVKKLYFNPKHVPEDEDEGLKFDAVESNQNDPDTGDQNDTDTVNQNDPDTVDQNDPDTGDQNDTDTGDQNDAATGDQNDADIGDQNDTETQNCSDQTNQNQIIETRELETEDQIDEANHNLDDLETEGQIDVANQNQNDLKALNKIDLANQSQMDQNDPETHNLISPETESRSEVQEHHPEPYSDSDCSDNYDLDKSKNKCKCC